jgi:hypothetical protein
MFGKSFITSPKTPEVKKKTPSKTKEKPEKVSSNESLARSRGKEKSGSKTDTSTISEALSPEASMESEVPEKEAKSVTLHVKSYDIECTVSAHWLELRPTEPLPVPPTNVKPFSASALWKPRDSIANLNLIAKDLTFPSDTVSGRDSSPSKELTKRTVPRGASSSLLTVKKPEASEQSSEAEGEVRSMLTEVHRPPATPPPSIVSLLGKDSSTSTENATPTTKAKRQLPALPTTPSTKQTSEGT